MENKNDMSFMCAADNITYQKAKELYYNLDKYDEAFPTIKNEAENGNPEAQYILAEMYFYAFGTSFDADKAIEWYNRSACNGWPNAMEQLGDMYANGIEVDEDEDIAQKWYVKAIKEYQNRAEKGDAESLYYLAGMYYWNSGTIQNRIHAFDLYKMAAEKGDADAKFQLGKMYSYGEGVEQDYTKSEEWYRAAAEDFRREAEQGNLNRQCQLADMYLSSECKYGLEYSPEKAMQLYDDAANKGFSHALYELGKMYLYGSGYDLEADKIKGYKYLREAAEQDSICAQAKLCVDIWLESTDYDQEKCNLEEMYKWALKGAEHGNDTCQLILGCMYSDGLFVQKDINKAREWFCKAASRGNVDAQYDLGEMYYYGNGVKKDYFEAIKWYKKAADNYDFRAMYNIADMYEYGDGVEYDLAKAFEWYDRASVEIVHAEEKLIVLWPLGLDPEQL